MELYGTEEEDISGCDTQTEDWFLDGFGLYVWFVDKKKHREHWQMNP